MDDDPESVTVQLPPEATRVSDAAPDVAVVPVGHERLIAKEAPEVHVAEMVFGAEASTV